MVPGSTDRAAGGSSDPRWSALAVAVVVAIAVALPFLVGNFRLFQLSMVLVYAIALLGLNVLTGWSGQISIGHGAFYALGAYTAAIMMDRWGVPFYATVPAAAFVCFVVGFLFGLPALRLEGLYLALATFALSVATPQLLKYKGVEEWTGGVQGIFITKPDVPAGLPLSVDQWIYFVCLLTCLVMFWLGANLVRGRIGRALIAIRDHSTAAATMGVDLARYKAITFGVSSLYAGVAGALSCIVVQFVAPDSFSMFVSITFLVGIVVGGIASVSGAIYGAVFIVFLPNVADQISKSAPWAIYGFLLIVIVFAMPGGVAGALASLWARRRRSSPLRGADATVPAAPAHPEGAQP